MHQANILVIDDSEPLLEAFQYILKYSGYKVKGMLTSHNLFRQIFNERPDIILLDVRLNDTDGREICKSVKSNPDTQNIQIILMSADSKALECNDCEADAILQKPFNIADVRRIIQLLLEKRACN